MTDTPNEPEQTPEVPDITDEEAAELVDVTALGVDGTPTAENYSHNREVYMNHLKICLDFAEKSKSGNLTGDIKTDVLETLKKAVSLPETDSLEKSLLEQIYDLLENSPDQVMHVLAAVDSVKTYVQDTKNCLIDMETQSIKLETGVTETPDETAEDAKLVCQSVRSIMRAQLLISKLTPKQFPVPEDFPYKVGANGEWLPDIPGLPKTRGGVSNAGRGAKKGKVLYSWKAKDTAEFVDLREGILTGEIANRIVSFRSYRVTNAQLQEHFTPKGKIDQFSHEPWEIEFETGTLRGFLPKK